MSHASSLHFITMSGKVVAWGDDVGDGHRHEAAHSCIAYTLLRERSVGWLYMQCGTAVRVRSGQVIPL